MKNKDVTIARRLASQMWGQPDMQKKLAEGIWLFETPRHGGIVVDAAIRPAILKVCQVTEVLIRAESKWKRPSEQHFVALEEDCCACIAEWLFAEDVITDSLYRMYDTFLPFAEWKAKRLKCIRKSLEMWNPDVLTTFPNPNMGIET